MINARAVLDVSPNSTFMNYELDSLVRFITSKERISKNIIIADFKQLSSRQFRGKKFKHMVYVGLHIKPANLWEGAMNYIWKHLGGDT